MRIWHKQAFAYLDRTLSEGLYNNKLTAAKDKERADRKGICTEGNNLIDNK